VDLGQLLAEIRARRLILRVSRRRRIVLWAPNIHVPMAVRRAIRTYNSDLHRREWYHQGQQQYVCAICERLAPYIEEVQR
jgi:hypothetical protein